MIKRIKKFFSDAKECRRNNQSIWGLLVIDFISRRERKRWEKRVKQETSNN